MAASMDVSKMAARYKLKMPGGAGSGAAPALSSTDLGAAGRGRSRKGSRDSITPPDERILVCTLYLLVNPGPTHQTVSTIPPTAGLCTSTIYPCTVDLSLAHPFLLPAFLSKFRY